MVIFRAKTSQISRKKMTSTLNPLADEYDPVLTALQELSEKIAESVLDPIDLERIDLEQVAQITFKDRLFELYWNGKHAILENRRGSWQFPNMTIRKIICTFFGPVDFDYNTALDEPASYAPAIVINIL